MEVKNRNLILVGVIICVVIAALSPFIASGDPDGLEKSAEDSGVPESIEAPIHEAPFPDYTWGDSKMGEIAVLVFGIVITLVAAFGAAYVLKRKDD